MKRLMTTAAALVALLPAHASAAACADAAQLHQLKTETWPAAYREGDVGSLDRLLHADFRAVDGEGAVSRKADELAWLSKHRWSAEDFRFEIVSLECSGDVAVIIGTGSMKSATAGERSSYVSSNIFVKQDGRWRVLASHVSGEKTIRAP